MVMPVIPKPLYPLVPNVAGIPAVLRGKAASIDALTFGLLGASDSLGNIIGTGLDPWGFFDSDGNSIADYDSLFSFDFDSQSRISDYPVEEGGFASYNKVNSPYDSIVVITCGGSNERRAACLTAVSYAKGSTGLYTVFTPTDIVLDASIIGMSYSSRADAGATLLTIQMTLREVRQTGQAIVKEPKSVGAFTPQFQGQIQTVDDPKIDTSGYV